LPAASVERQAVCAVNTLGSVENSDALIGSQLLAYCGIRPLVKQTAALPTLPSLGDEFVIFKTKKCSHSQSKRIIQADDHPAPEACEDRSLDFIVP
jgi:hypothetical protein